MIVFEEQERYFHLHGEKTSYVLRILPTGHLGHVYYGEYLPQINVTQLEPKFAIEVGNQVLVDPDDRTFNLNTSFLETSTYGKGDYREPMSHFRFPDGSRLSDFRYHSHEILEGKPSFEVLPESHVSKDSSAQTLVVELRDEARQLALKLYYTMFEKTDVLVRRVVIENVGGEAILIERAMSMQLDLPNRDYRLLSFDGAWIRERSITEHPLSFGVWKIDSKKGVSGNDHNPSLVLKEPSTTEEMGRCYGFSLVYSGSFEAMAEVSPHSIVRILFGINSFDFYYQLDPHKTFVTPEVAMTYSNGGLNGLSLHFHEFVKHNVVPEYWSFRERPIVVNNWEATYFDFNERKLLKLAKAAAKLGVEMFVLDDGWFGNRNDDTSSLGDWVVNRKKLPSGIQGLAKKIQKLGLSFGIWVEPEMISPNSELFQNHPDWAIRHPLYEPSLGRNQLVLDLANVEVQDFLIETIQNLLDSADISYVKWDMNRNLSDAYSPVLLSNQGSFFYQYQVGLFRVLKTITSQFPHVLFESCASGGNRYDLGMLTVMPQVWVSDNTDGIERLKIQYGTSYFYPPSTMGAHVSQIPNQQTLRKTTLETRFNTASFGLLGYEMDLTQITPYEKKVIRAQIAYYKKHRALLQFGRFQRFLNPFQDKSTLWSVVSDDQKSAMVGLYRIQDTPNGPHEIVRISGLDETKKYRLTNRAQTHHLDTFGHLIHHALPIKISPDGLFFLLLKNRYLLPIEKEDFITDGATLNHFGFQPKQPFIGSGYHEGVRLMGDGSSRLYYLECLEGDTNENTNSAQ